MSTSTAKPANTTQQPPEIGQFVVARGQRYIAVSIKPSQHPGKALSQNLVTLSSAEDDSLGEELQVVWELELDAAGFEREELPGPAAFDDPNHRRRTRRTPPPPRRDAAVVAYVWQDIALNHNFYGDGKDCRYAIHPDAKSAVLRRLLKLNHQRYAAEVAAGLHEKGTSRSRAARSSSAAEEPDPLSVPRRNLFDDQLTLSET